jgi:Ca-activated chloride channel family protein
LKETILPLQKITALNLMLYDWIKNLDFNYPYVFGLFLLLPLLIGWYYKRHDRQQGHITVSTVHAFAVKTWKNRFRHLPFILRLIALSSLILALARPQNRYEEQRSEGEGIDIILCMDVSGSMGSTDIAPSRMEAAKEVADEFVRARPVDRIGLVVFAGESFTQCPLTGDRNMLLTQIRNLQTRQFDNIRGTVIGEGLATSVDRLTQSESKSKVIILLTDGKEDPPETRLIDPLTALEIAKTKKVKVYTIGISGEPAPMPQNADAPRGGKNPNADFLDEQLLTSIASGTGGQYFRARDKEGLQRVYRQIDQLEKSKVEISFSTRSEERFIPFILAALVLVFLELLLKFTLFRKFP